jgi:hypothetical protein
VALFTDAGYTPVDSEVISALISDALSPYNAAEIKSKFHDISSVLQNLAKSTLGAYLPGASLNAADEKSVESSINRYRGNDRSAKRVHWMVRELMPRTVKFAATELAMDSSFDYPKSTTYDAVLKDGTSLAPKAVIGFTGQQLYGAPLMPEDFSGGEGTPAFERLRSAGLAITLKADPESELFRKAVKEKKKKKFTKPPVGSSKPAKYESKTTSYSRDTNVVAYVEQRANGVCELCGEASPFTRPDGTPYLEVHHIKFLSEKGRDKPDNTAGICPNCHRECHYGANSVKLKTQLIEKVSLIQQAYEAKQVFE